MQTAETSSASGMGFRSRLTRIHFNFVYNPFYDFIVTRLPAYHRLQSACIAKLELAGADRVLCVGVGTGNEIVHIWEANEKVAIVGVDRSEAALKRVSRKALARGGSIELRNMEAQNLEFAPESFDKALCLHVMDFVEDDRKATAEILRVLKDGGQFVITYPSVKEGIGLGAGLLRDSIRSSSGAGKCVRALSVLLAMLLGAIAYSPLLLRPKRRMYSSHELEAMFSELAGRSFQIEAYPAYADFIVYGRK